jgi:P-loop containing NTP hydrolase pore-1
MFAFFIRIPIKAGVGKGRQLAGIIHDNWKKGRVKHLWFSASADLKQDAQRDIDDIHADEVAPHLFLLTDLAYGTINKSQGVIFSTYSSLVAGKRGGDGMTRLEQLVDWCGGDAFSGCIMFDECHKAKTLILDGGQGVKDKSSKAGLAVHELQSRLPNARVVYCSATGASEVDNLAYMTRYVGRAELF